jgi:Fe2+ or Zn2+ uptake regulation protein
MATRRDAEELSELVEGRLRRTEKQYTKGRRALVELLADLGHPASIADISARLPDLPTSSAYRHLVDLQGAGVVRRLAGSDEFARFELAEDLTEHHHHLVCTRCGRVTDVTPSPAFERTVSRTVEQLAASHQFQPISHDLDVMGHCAACS